MKPGLVMFALACLLGIGSAALGFTFRLKVARHRDALLSRLHSAAEGLSPPPPGAWVAVAEGRGLRCLSEHCPVEAISEGSKAAEKLLNLASNGGGCTYVRDSRSLGGVRHLATGATDEVGNRVVVGRVLWT